MKKKVGRGPYTFSHLGEKKISPHPNARLIRVMLSEALLDPPTLMEVRKYGKSQALYNTMYLPSIEMSCHSYNLYNSGPLGGGGTQV